MKCSLMTLLLVSGLYIYGLTRTTQNLRAVNFADANNGWAVRDSGTIIHTTNAGAIWEQQTRGTIPLNDVFFNNVNKGCDYR